MVKITAHFLFLVVLCHGASCVPSGRFNPFPNPDPALGRYTDPSEVREGGPEDAKVEHYKHLFELAEGYQFANTLNMDTLIMSRNAPQHPGGGYSIAYGPAYGDKTSIVFLDRREALIVNTTSLDDLSLSQKYYAEIQSKRKPSLTYETLDYWSIDEMATGKTLLSVTEDELLKKLIPDYQDYNFIHLDLIRDNAVMRWSPDEKGVYYRVYVGGVWRKGTDEKGLADYRIMKTTLETKQHTEVYAAYNRTTTDRKTNQTLLDYATIMDFWVSPDGERIVTDELRTRDEKDGHLSHTRVFVMVNIKDGKGTDIPSTGSKSRPAFSPEGKYVYFFDDRGLVQMVAAEPDRQRVLFQGKGQGLSVSPDGKKFAMNDGRGILIATPPEAKGEKSRIEVIARVKEGYFKLDQTVWTKDGRFVGGAFQHKFPEAPGYSYAYIFVIDLKEKKLWANMAGNYYFPLFFIENPEVIEALRQRVDEARANGPYVKAFSRCWLTLPKPDRSRR